ncbi:MAG TPA: patatin-like phospholipase family protein [Acidimicrobiales bacterium]
MKVDVVLEGGGVKGIALVGALTALEEHGFEIHRVAGASAGAIVGALAAAGMDAKEMRDVVASIDYSQFKDPGFLERLGLPGKGLSLLFEQGIYEGRFLETWLTAQLAALGVSTFADLRDADTDQGSATADPKKSSKLVVTASDISNGRLAYLPWDYQGHYPTSAEADGGMFERSVVEAVRCSMSIPFFYEPHRLKYRRQPTEKREVEAVMVDGGMLSNFPVQVFDRTDGRTPRWPTLGIKLSNRPEEMPPPKPVDGPIEFVQSLLTTMMGFSDRVHIENPKVISRTIFVDTLGVSATEFDRVSEDAKLRDDLFESGLWAARKFLDGDGTPEHPKWTFERYVTEQAAPET